MILLTCTWSDTAIIGLFPLGEWAVSILTSLDMVVMMKKKLRVNQGWNLNRLHQQKEDEFKSMVD